MGSSEVMAETLHSLADTTNQVFLLLRIRFYTKPASEKHPFGFGKERFFWRVRLADFCCVKQRRKKSVENIRQAINSHPSVVEVIELLTLHLAPKQILVNAYVNMKDDLTTQQIVDGIKKIETLIKKAEPKVDGIFLEAARQSEPDVKNADSDHL